MIRSQARRRWIPLAALLTLLLAALPFAARGGPAGAQDDAVAADIVDFAFEPGTIEISVGTTVTWTNQGDAPHTVTSDDGVFDSGAVAPGASFSWTFEEAGTFAYHCEIHPRMTATVVVTEGDAAVDGEGDEDAAGPPTAEATPEPAEDAARAPDVLDLEPVAEPRLAHVHAGSCEELGIVVYSLPDLRSYRIEPEDDGGQPVEMIVGTAQVPLADLFNEPFSVHIHESAANKQNYIACADVGEQPPDPWTEEDGLALRLAEQFDSGLSGIASLRPSADGGTAVTMFLAQGQTEDGDDGGEARPTPPPGTTYTSPTFGYTISYGPTWRVTEDVSSGGRDRFVLYNGTSYVTFTGARGFDGDPQRCVDDFVATLTADPNVSNLELAEDEQGNPLQGGTEATGAFAVYNHDYTFPDRVEAYTLFVGCIPLVEGEAVLAVVQNVPTAEYNDQVEPREGLLRGLTLPQ